MKPLHRRFLAIATLVIAAATKAHVAGDVPEEHEDNTFGLPNGDLLRKSLRRFFAEQVKKIVGEVEKLGADLKWPVSVLADYDDAMASAMSPILGVYWSKSGKALRGRLGLDPDDWRVTDPNLHAAIAAQAFDFCASTNATTDRELAAAHAQLREELQAGLVDEGEAIPELVKRVRKVFTRASKERAAAIARTEAARAVHSAALKSAADSGVVAGKKWLTSANSCALCHRLADDVGTIALDQTFAVVGKSATYSQIRTPPAHPHCRCSLTFDLTDPDADPVPAWEHPPAGTIAPAKPRKKAEPAPEPPPVAEPDPEPEPEPADTWPADPNKLRVVRTLGGSTGAELVEDAAGNRYVRKRGANAEHLRSEVTADLTYRAFDVPVPEPRLYETAGGPVKLARFIEGKTLGQLRKDNPKLAREAEAKLRDHFAVDALLGNWDVIGMSADNVLVDAEGTPWRIDNGGSLDYRAQGGKKTPDQWNANPIDLWSIRDPKVNPSAAGVFHQVTSDQWAAQVLELARADVTFHDDVDTILRERLGQMADLAEVHQTLRDDRFKPSYTDDFTRHTCGIRAAGLSERMPTSMERREVDSGDALDKVQVFDQDGKLWDHLRGKGSLAEEFDSYITGLGGDPGILSHWKSQQGGDSWNAGPQAARWFIASERTLDVGDYWWKEGTQTAEANYTKAMARVGADAYRTSMIAHHAYTREMLAKAHFENKTPDGMIQLVRTENRDVMQLNKLKVGARGAVIKRGLAESCSLYRRVTVFGSELTVQKVPLHRITGTYWQARSGSDSQSSFLGNLENEFVALLDGIPFDYVSKMPPGLKNPKETEAASGHGWGVPLDEFLDPESIAQPAKPKKKPAKKPKLVAPVTALADKKPPGENGKVPNKVGIGKLKAAAKAAEQEYWALYLAKPKGNATQAQVDAALTKWSQAVLAVEAAQQGK